MPTDGPRRPSSNAGATGLTLLFDTSPANAYDADTATAATAPGANANGVSYGHFFAFNTTAFSAIPSGSTIDAVSLKVRQSVSNANRSDQFFRLDSANGTAISSEIQQDATTTATDYNLSAWSALPTRAQLVSGTFGIRVRHIRTNTVAPSLFDLELTVTYSGPSGSSALSGSGTLAVAGVRIRSGVSALSGAGALTADGTVIPPSGGWGPPQNLIATAINASRIDLSWDAVTGASGYDVERNGAVIAQDVAATSYSDTGLTPSTLYTYRVRAVGG